MACMSMSLCFKAILEGIQLLSEGVSILISVCFYVLLQFETTSSENICMWFAVTQHAHSTNQILHAGTAVTLCTLEVLIFLEYEICAYH